MGDADANADARSRWFASRNGGISSNDSNNTIDSAALADASPIASTNTPANSGVALSGSNTAAALSPSSSSSATAMPKPTFDCNICLDTVTSPVVTLCGHLYCWPCLYQWMDARSECPVCKAGISVDNVIPVYGRGSESADPRAQEMGENGIPSRPRGQRPDPEQLRRRQPRQPFGGVFTTQRDAGFVMSPTLAFFPALFGLPFQPPAAATHRPDGTPLTPMEARQQMQQVFLSRLLLVVGSLVILCLLMF